MQQDTEKPANWWLFAAIAVYLTLICLWRVITPGTEFALSRGVWLDIIIKGLLTGVLAASYPRLIRSLAHDYTRQMQTKWLFRVGVASGIIIILLRFSSRTGWWTGHLTYQFPH